MLNALRNYKEVWKRRDAVLGKHELYRVNANEAWKRIGFMRYLMEYWRLALIIYRVIAGKHEPCRDLQRKCGVDSFEETEMGHIHDMVQRFQDVNLGEYEL